jgi:hypothetical protein
MRQAESYKNYPCWIMLISNLVSFLIYLIGAVIISRIGPVWLGLYLAYIVWLELRVMRHSCVNCYYYGRYCAFGKGKISSWLFRKGDPRKFLKREITWKDILPDFLVSLVPLIAGIIILALNFSWLLLMLIVLLVVLTSVGNGFVRGSLACKFCKQREIGCPAEKLFNRKKKR